MGILGLHAGDYRQINPAPSANGTIVFASDHVGLDLVMATVVLMHMNDGFFAESPEFP